MYISFISIVCVFLFQLFLESTPQAYQKVNNFDIRYLQSINYVYVHNLIPRLRRRHHLHLHHLRRPLRRSQLLHLEQLTFLYKRLLSQ